MGIPSVKSGGFFMLNKLIISLWVVSSLVACGGNQALNDKSVSMNADLGKSGSGQSSIINGELVASDEGISRSIVALVLRRGEQVRSFCTATLLSNELAITAAHCADVFTKAKVEVMFGLAEEGAAVQFRPLVQFVTHEQYIDLQESNEPARSNRERQSTSTPGATPMVEQIQNYLPKIREAFGVDHYDLTLVRFSGGLPEGYVPAKVSRGDQISDLSRVILAGYGDTSGVSQLDSKPGQLRKTQVPVAKLDYSSTEFITDESRSGSCRGDSGGPVFFQTLGGEVELVGVTSRGDEKCRLLGIYTYLPAFVSWLNEASQSMGLDPILIL